VNATTLKLTAASTESVIETVALRFNWLITARAPHRSAISRPRTSVRWLA